jgi:TPR repeat protein
MRHYCFRNILLCIALAVALPAPFSACAETHKYSAEELSELRALSGRGDADAQEKLGSLYAEGYSIDKNEKEAVKWWKKAAAQGNAAAQYELGIAYHEGSGGLSQSDKKALEWFRKAALQDEPRAELNVGIAYYHGIGVDKDVAEAMKWFQRAADKDIAQAQYILAAGYYKGVGGLEHDRVKAYVWMKQAVNNGNKDAKEDLPGLEALMTPLELQMGRQVLADTGQK